MGRDARANAHLSKQERQDRRLRAAARNFRNEEHLYEALSGMAEKDWQRCLDVMWTHVTFATSAAKLAWLKKKLSADNEFIAKQASIAKALKDEGKAARRIGEIAQLGISLTNHQNLFDDEGELVACPSWLTQLAEMRGVTPQSLLPSRELREQLSDTACAPVIDITLEEARRLWPDAEVPASVLQIERQHSMVTGDNAAPDPDDHELARFTDEGGN